MNEESVWRVVASLVVSVAASALVLLFVAPAASDLSELATFTPEGPIRPMGLSIYIMGGVFSGLFIAAPSSLLALKLSQRSWARAAGFATYAIAALPGLCWLLFFVIVFARGIQLGD